MGAGAQTGGVYWDVFLMFEKDARWDAFPSPVVDAGSTVIRIVNNRKRRSFPFCEINLPLTRWIGPLRKDGPDDRTGFSLP